MKHRVISFVTTLLLILTACTPANQITSVPVIDSATATSSPLPTATATATITPLPTIPTFTPTFDASTILTVTPAPQAECPKEISDLVFDSNNLKGSGNDYNQQFIDYTLDYLNSGGSPQSIRMNYAHPDEIVRKEDLTGDGIGEVIFAYGIWIDIFGCINGDYQLLTASTKDAAQGSKIIDVVDINLDGLAEMISYFDGCMGSRCPSIEILGWDGEQFQSLIENPFSSIEGCSYMGIAPFQVEIQDIDNNGTSEIIFQNTGNPWPDDLDFPYRKETRICTWNGKNIVLYQIYFDNPDCRFQALQDAERAMQSDDFRRALDFYNKP